MSNAPRQVGEGSMGGFATRVLYAAESAVVALLSKGEALPDKPVTPSGFVLA
jgi:hypothetical protein